MRLFFVNSERDLRAALDETNQDRALAGDMLVPEAPVSLMQDLNFDVPVQVRICPSAALDTNGYRLTMRASVHPWPRGMIVQFCYTA